MLRLKVRIRRVDGKFSQDLIAIANSGFVGLKPEIVLPQNVINDLKLNEVAESRISRKITGDGREIQFVRFENSVEVYLIAEDRTEGPIIADAITTHGARYVLLNDKLLGAFRIVLLDFAEGIWCFRDELGKKERRSY